MMPVLAPLCNGRRPFDRLTCPGSYKLQVDTSNRLTSLPNSADLKVGRSTQRDAQRGFQIGDGRG